MADVVAALGASAHPQNADLRQTQRPGHQRCAVGLQALAAPPTGRRPVPGQGIARGGAMSRLLYWLSGLLPCLIISDNGNPHLERYYVGPAFGVRFYLHRFVGSDPTRGLHDHPWPWPWPWARALVLSGWYYEQLRTGTRKVRWFNRLSGDTFHRV